MYAESQGKGATRASNADETLSNTGYRVIQGAFACACYLSPLVLATITVSICHGASAPWEQGLIRRASRGVLETYFFFPVVSLHGRPWKVVHPTCTSRQDERTFRAFRMKSFSHPQDSDPKPSAQVGKPRKFQTCDGKSNAYRPPQSRKNPAQRGVD